MRLTRRALLAAALAASAAARPRLALSVGGAGAPPHLPLILAQRLGLFAEQGLAVEVVDRPPGARTVMALVFGQVDATLGAFEHTIRMAARGVAATAFVALGRTPGLAVARRGGPGGLAGLRVGITSPGSATHNLARLLPADGASFVPLATDEAVAALAAGRIDALAHGEPAISRVQSGGTAVVVADARHPAGAERLYGGPHPGLALYARPAFLDGRPDEAAALARAFTRCLGWMAAAKPAEIVAALPPEWREHWGGAPTHPLLSNLLPSFSPDGRFAEGGPETVLRLLARFDESIAAAHVDLAATFTNSLVRESR